MAAVERGGEGVGRSWKMGKSLGEAGVQVGLEGFGVGSGVRVGGPHPRSLGWDSGGPSQLVSALITPEENLRVVP